MSSWISVITSSKVTVIGSHNCVLVSFLHVFPVPLSDAWTAGVGQNGASKLTKSFGNSITLNGGADLLRSGSDVEWNLGLNSVLQGIFNNAGATSHIFVGRVGARSNKSNLDVDWIAICLGVGSKFADGMGQIGSERSIDMGFKSVQVDFNYLKRNI